MKHPKHFQDRTIKPLVVSILAGIATFCVYFYLFGGRTTKVVNRPVAEQVDHDGEFPAFSPKTIDDGSAIQPDMTAEQEKIQRMREKLQPKHLVDVDGKIVEHQFLHLHHMKTGGTCT